MHDNHAKLDLQLQVPFEETLIMYKHSCSKFVQKFLQKNVTKSVSIATPNCPRVSKNPVNLQCLIPYLKQSVVRWVQFHKSNPHTWSIAYFTEDSFKGVYIGPVFQLFSFLSTTTCNLRPSSVDSMSKCVQGSRCHLLLSGVFFFLHQHGIV